MQKTVTQKQLLGVAWPREDPNPSLNRKCHCSELIVFMRFGLFFSEKEFEIQHQTNDRENSPDFETGNNYIVSTKLCVYLFLVTIARSTTLKKKRHAQMPCTVKIHIQNPVWELHRKTKRNVYGVKETKEGLS